MDSWARPVVRPALELGSTLPLPLLTHRRFGACVCRAPRLRLRPRHCLKVLMTPVRLSQSKMTLRIFTQLWLKQTIFHRLRTRHAPNRFWKHLKRLLHHVRLLRAFHHQKQWPVCRLRHRRHLVTKRHLQHLLLQKVNVHGLALIA